MDRSPPTRPICTGKAIECCRRPGVVPYMGQEAGYYPSTPMKRRCRQAGIPIPMFLFPKVNCQLYSVSTFEKNTSKVICQLLRYSYSSKVNLDWSRTFSTVLEYSRRFEKVRDWSRTFWTVLEYSRRFQKVRDCEGSLTRMNFCEGSLIRGQSVNPRSTNKNKPRGFTNGAE